MQRTSNHARRKATIAMPEGHLALTRVVRLTTPCMPLSRHVVRFCQELSPGKLPVLLPLTAINPYHLEANCHINVMQTVRVLGGGRVFGWLIWEDSSIPFCEGIFHSVWRTPQGELIDVTPRQHGEAHVLFLEDPFRKVEREFGADLTYASRNSRLARPVSDGRMVIQQTPALALYLALLGFDPDHPIGVPVRGC